MGSICDLCLEDRLWRLGRTYCVCLQGDQTGTSGCWSDVIASKGRACFVLGKCLLLFSFGERLRGVHDLLGALLALQVGHCLACLINQSVRLDLPVRSSAAASCRLCLSSSWPASGPLGACGTLGTV
jgi:hypothetical protein